MRKARKTKQIMPQELEVWYVLPTIRRELAKALVALEWSREKIANTLGVSKASISHYMRNKRAKEVEFDEALRGKIREAAARIVEDEDRYMTEVQDLCKFIRTSRRLCEIHTQMAQTTYATCTVCLE